MIDGAFLKVVLNKAVFHPVVTDNGVSVAKLRESDPSAGLKAVDIRGVSPDAVLLKMDVGAPPADMLRKELGQRCRCDYILLTEHCGKRFLVYIDLKTAAKGKLQKGGVVKQFKGARCMLMYMDAIIDVFHGQRGFFKSFDECRYVAFYKPSLYKKPTRPLPMKNDAPERFMKYPNPIRPTVRELVGI